MTAYQIPATSQLGHLLFRVADLDRSVAFYRDVLGMKQAGGVPNQAAYMTFGADYYHHIVLAVSNLEQSSTRFTGFDHIAINFVNRRDYALAIKQLRIADWPLDRTADYGHHLAVYLKDPDGNGLELAWDREPDEWLRLPDGKVRFIDPLPFDADALIAEYER